VAIKHTPLPWEAIGPNAVCIMANSQPEDESSCYTVAVLRLPNWDGGQRAEEDAEFICRAANNHDALLYLLDVASIWIENGDFHNGVTSEDGKDEGIVRRDAFLEELRQALHQAKGEVQP
jgi:hypothetical protein